MKSKALNATSVRSKQPLVPVVCSYERFWSHLHDLSYILSCLDMVNAKKRIKKPQPRTHGATATPSMLFWLKVQKLRADLKC